MFGKTKCPCCGMDLDQSIKEIAIKIENEIGQGLDILSGARCPRYNATMKDSTPDSPHIKGKALDIYIDPETPHGREMAAKILIAAVKYGINRFGDGMSNHHFIHIDNDDSLPTPRIWFYK